MKLKDVTIGMVVINYDAEIGWVSGLHHNGKETIIKIKVPRKRPCSDVVHEVEIPIHPNNVEPYEG